MRTWETLLLGLALLVGSSLSTLRQQECTASDYTASYTECKKGLRDLIYYWKQGSDCTVGSVKLPNNVFHLSCDITCGEGTYLPLGSMVCEPCNPGTFSIGGGVRVTDWSDSDHTWGGFDWKVYCKDKNGRAVGCDGWQMGGDGLYIYSGNITDNEQSILELGVTLIAEGHMHFQYRVDAEPGFDKLTFRINGESQFVTSITDGYARFSTNLTRGFYDFTWTYSKDYDRSEGEDAAFIKILEIGGLTYSQDECTPCARGQYNDDHKLEDCYDCPMNTYTDEVGQQSCKPCAANEYAYPGSYDCTERLPCTTNDYGVYYTDCMNGVRNKYYKFYEPVICNNASYTLPAVQNNLPCDQCDPGTYRDENSWRCKDCPDGTWSAVGAVGMAACTACDPGYAAVKGYNFVRWSEMHSELTTSCSGDCGSNGFRHMDSYIDSGIGHGVSVDVFLSMIAPLANGPGKVSFNFTLKCIRSCLLEFVDEGFQTASFDTATNRVVNYNLAWNPDDNGRHTLKWNFHRDDPTNANHNDRVMIHWIKVSGTSTGGASECVGCAAGTYSPGRVSQCTKCDVGEESAAKASTCYDCPPNYFNDVPGGVCLPCGHGTTSPQGSANCTTPCRYTTDFMGEWSRYTYNVEALKRDDEMWGPIYDDEYAKNDMTYYINVCSRKHHNHTCFDQRGNAIDSYACQITTHDYGVDLGRVMGFYDYEPNPAEGFILSYTQGKVCDNGPRQTNVTFICDPNAGVGAPVGTVPVESPTCRYNFIWNSTYGCPLCSPSHFTCFTLGQCRNGTQQQNCRWNSYPKRCHDGIALPNGRQVACVENHGIVCPAGQYVGDVSNGTNCTDCPAGHYSTGGGLEYSSWETLPEGFVSKCPDSNPGCSGWEARRHAIVASTHAKLSRTVQYDIAGNLTFTYWFSPDVDVGTLLRVLVDDVVATEISRLVLEPTKATIRHIDPGNHTITWEFFQYSPDPRRPHVAISNIYFGLGQAAQTFCFECPSGYAAGPNSGSCQICPANTRASAISYAVFCLKKKKGTYSVPGSTECKPVPEVCVADVHYATFHTKCVPSTSNPNGFQRWEYKQILTPSVCEEVPESNVTVECAPCPPFAYRSASGECVSCDKGFWNTGLGKCVDSSPGQFIARRLRLFEDEYSTSSWPTGWSTGCSGACFTPGWRVKGASIDSGDQSFDVYGPIDSWAKFTFTLITDGYIEFDFTSSSAMTTFQVYVGGVLQSLPTMGVRQHIAITKGTNAVVFNLFQPHGFRGVVTLSNVQLVGSNDGIAERQDCPPGHKSTGTSVTTCEICPAGTSSSYGQTTCTPCQPGTYAPSVGSAICQQCPPGSTNDQTGATSCDVTCKFNVTDTDITYSLEGFTETIQIVSIYGDWFINPCQHINEADCRRGNGSNIATAACLVDKAGTAHDNGKEVSFIPNTDTEIMDRGFLIRLSSGDKCEYNNGWRQTTLQVMCDPDVTTTRPTLSPVENNASLCDAHFLWSTIYGCPVCRDSDYMITAGECVDGTQDTFETKVNACNGPNTKNHKETSCSSTFKFPMGVVVASGIAFVALLAVAIFVFVKNRRISTKYNRLQESYNSMGHVQLDPMDSPPPSKKFSIEEDS
eukprot:TRINITY_DN1945_c0_g1_i2.p1 TRINITY_DN1945_c0_g1~~TRINITY_DN1945_c0_g1_i2.p1  ORF type:complete len:1604 (-),score=325.86 TRINITY_DN1945_c0_g1_i2:47-4858(-)